MAPGRGHGRGRGRGRGGNGRGGTRGKRKNNFQADRIDKRKRYASPSVEEHSKFKHKSTNNVYEDNRETDIVEDEPLLPYEELLSSLKKAAPVATVDTYLEEESSEKDVSDNSGDDNDVNSEDDDESSAEDDDEDEKEDVSSGHDPFCHFQKVLADSDPISLDDKSEWKSEWITCPVLGKILYSTNPKTQTDFSLKGKNSINATLKEQLINNLKAESVWKAVGSKNTQLTPFQEKMYNLICNYQDVYYSERTHKNGEELRFVYCLHVLNHLLKSRSKVIHHNAKLTDKDDIPDQYRDQGLVRPKVVIIVPFKESALRVVKVLMSVISTDEKSNIINKSRFQTEYGSVGQPGPRARQRPEDYDATFAGNIDDMFRIGISFTKKSLRLYTAFYSADLIIASPLGLRSVIGAAGESGYDYDFISSVEMLIMDQTDVFMMQNWEHVMHVFDHLHLTPREAHDTNFSRVRMWALDGRSKYYRQTLIFSGVSHPTINAIFNRQCVNHDGKYRILNPVDSGSICQLVVQLPQVFHNFNCNLVELPDARFNFFVTKILPQFKNSAMSRTMIFVPSYFDYVRVRNYFKKEELSFVQICEYSKDGKVARARDYFFHGKRHFLLYTERAHFFHRYVIKGMRHIIFYELPIHPHFYSELGNLLQVSTQTSGEGNSVTCTVLYAKEDAHQLAAIVGTQRASIMLNSERKTHMFVTGDT